MSKHLATILFLSFLLLSLQTMASDCFNQTTVRGFENNGKDSVIVKAFKTSYQVNTFACFDLEWADSIAFRSWIGNSIRICRGDDLFVIDVYSGRVKQKCRIREITKIIE